jgi:Fic family protein
MQGRIVGSQVVRPNYLKVESLMHDLAAWVQNEPGHIAVIAAQAHLKLVFIHPFVDGNGRTARLLMNLLLLQEGYPLTIIEKEERTAYLAAIEKALKSQDPVDFYHLIFRAVERGLDTYIQAAQESAL